MPNCEVCGEPLPPGEEMFKYHGYSGPCPKPPLQPAPKMTNNQDGWMSRALKLEAALVQIRAVCEDNPNMANNFIDEVARKALEKAS